MRAFLVYKIKKKCIFAVNIFLKYNHSKNHDKKKCNDSDWIIPSML